jgi:hypothetical protein
VHDGRFTSPDIGSCALIGRSLQLRHDSLCYPLPLLPPGWPGTAAHHFFSLSAASYVNPRVNRGERVRVAETVGAEAAIASNGGLAGSGPCLARHLWLAGGRADVRPVYPAVGVLIVGSPAPPARVSSARRSADGRAGGRSGAVEGGAAQTRVALFVVASGGP